MRLRSKDIKKKGINWTPSIVLEYLTNILDCFTLCSFVFTPRVSSLVGWLVSEPSQSVVVADMVTDMEVDMLADTVAVIFSDFHIVSVSEPSKSVLWWPTTTCWLTRRWTWLLTWMWS